MRKNGVSGLMMCLLIKPKKENLGISYGVGKSTYVQETHQGGLAEFQKHILKVLELD
jgi:hypothetical protein